MSVHRDYAALCIEVSYVMLFLLITVEQIWHSFGIKTEGDVVIKATQDETIVTVSEGC